MPPWAQWTLLWRRPMALFAWFTSMILWVCGNHKKTISTEQDLESGQKYLESGQKSSPSVEEVSDAHADADALKDQVEPSIDDLQTSIRALGAGTSSNLIGVGVFAYVYDLGDGRVRKLPSPDPDNLDFAVKSIRREREIYDHLGNHPRVIRCLAKGDLFVDLEFASHGHVEGYLQHHPDTSERCRIRFAQEVIEAVVFIHSKRIIHSDLAARQFLLDDTLHVRLSDFGFSSFGNHDVLGFENASHHLPRDIDGEMPSTVQSDLFALGSTLYEVMTGEPPYQGKADDVIAQLYANGSFPDVTAILCGHILMGCWQGRFKSAAEVLGAFMRHDEGVSAPC